MVRPILSRIREIFPGISGSPPDTEPEQGTGLAWPDENWMLLTKNERSRGGEDGNWGMPADDPEGVVYNPQLFV